VVKQEEGIRYAMENPVPVTEFETAKSHGDPALDIRWEEDERSVFDDHFQIGVEEFQDEIQVGF
jgi:hypothetical protein